MFDCRHRPGCRSGITRGVGRVVPVLLSWRTQHETGSFSFVAPFWSVNARASASWSFVADWPTPASPSPAWPDRPSADVPFRFPAVASDEASFDCETEPPSPGLSTRTGLFCVRWFLLRCPCGGPCVLARFRLLAGEPCSRGVPAAAVPTPCDEQEEDEPWPARGNHVSSVSLRAVGVTPCRGGTAPDYGPTALSQGGRSRSGTAARAQLPRNPDPPPQAGGGETKKPITVARPKVRVLGAAPPVEVEEPAAPSGGGNSNGRRCPCDEVVSRGACARLGPVLRQRLLGPAPRSVGCGGGAPGRAGRGAVGETCERRVRIGRRCERFRRWVGSCDRDLDRADRRRDDDRWQFRQRRLGDPERREARDRDVDRDSHRRSRRSGERRPPRGRKRRPLRGFPCCRVEVGCTWRREPRREGGTGRPRHDPRNSEHPLGYGLGPGEAWDRERRRCVAPVLDGRARWCLVVRRGRFRGWSAAAAAIARRRIVRSRWRLSSGCAVPQPEPVPVPVETRALAGERGDLGGRAAPGERPCPHPRRVTRPAWRRRRRRVRLCDGAVVAWAQGP